MGEHLQKQMRDDIESFGWQCHEVKLNDEWTITFSRGKHTIISQGITYQSVWNAAYKAALRATPTHQGT